MPTKITINDITGETPYDIYVCNNPITTCIYVDTIESTSLPYEFDVPCVMDSMVTFTLKTIDNVGCTDLKILTL